MVAVASAAVLLPMRTGFGATGTAAGAGLLGAGGVSGRYLTRVSP